MQPAIDSSGKLTFTPQPNSSGTARVTIVLVDDGGTSGDGADTCGPQTFTIVVDKPHARHNSAVALDVTFDGLVAAGDALAVINYLNAYGPGPPTAVGGPPYCDVTADNVIAPDDALAIINHINALGAGDGEGVAMAVAAPAITEAEMLNLLALDVALQPKRRR